MWKCAKCGERHADHFSSCWKCAGLDAPPRSFKVASPLSLSCARCSNALTLVGHQSLRDAHGVATGLGQVLVNHEQLEVHLCPRCGQIELFVAGGGEQYRNEAQHPRTAEAKAEHLLREATQLEGKAELEAAVAQYEQVMAKFPGTSLAREAELRLLNIRNKFGI
jgi:hypothetical protein